VALYAGLLAKAHSEGLKAITTTLLHFPDERSDHTAVVHATVETNKGTFTGIGDASPKNVNRRILPHIVRMAETRAKARALRDAVNIGIVALDELGELLPDDEVPETQNRELDNGRPSNGGGRPEPVQHRSRKEPQTNGEPWTTPQRRLLMRLMAEQGLRGRQAEDRLCQLMDIQSIDRATKRRASGVIERLKDNGSSGRPQAH